MAYPIDIAIRGAISEITLPKLYNEIMQGLQGLRELST